MFKSDNFKEIKKGVNFAVGVLLVLGIFIGVYAFVEPDQSSTSEDYYINSGSKILRLLTGINQSVANSTSNSLPKGSVDWRDCEVLQIQGKTSGAWRVSCSAGYELVSHSCNYLDNYDRCGFVKNNILEVYKGDTNNRYVSGTIKCCRLVK